MDTVVVVAGLIEMDGKVLLVRKPKGIGPYPDTWHIPGGKLEQDEGIIEALEREVKEETGLKLEGIEHLSFDEDFEPDKHGKLTHFIFLQFKATAMPGEARAMDDVIESMWASKKDLSGLGLNKPTIKLLRKIGLIE